MQLKLNSMLNAKWCARMQFSLSKLIAKDSINKSGDVN